MKLGATVFTIRQEIGDMNFEATVSMTQQEIGGTNLEVIKFTIQQETGWVRNFDLPTDKKDLPTTGSLARWRPCLVRNFV
jgi:hypothetical protein